MKMLLTLLPLVAMAQGVSGIRSGFVFDPQARMIRPVNGLPGTAVLGEGLDLGISLDQVEFARGSDVAFAAAEDGLYRVTLSTASAQRIDGVIPGGRLVGAGLVWVESARTIQFLHDLSQAIVISDGELTAATLHPQTNCALLAFSAGNVESICGSRQTRLFADSASMFTRIAVNADSIVGLDSANSRIIQFAGALPKAVLASGLLEPVGLAAVADTFFAVAEAGSQRVSFVSTGSAPPEPISLLFTPTGLSYLGPNILQLGAAGAQPFEVVDLSQERRSFFVPAIAQVANSVRAGK